MYYWSTVYLPQNGYSYYVQYIKSNLQTAFLAGNRTQLDTVPAQKLTKYKRGSSQRVGQDEVPRFALDMNPVHEHKPREGAQKTNSEGFKKTYRTDFASNA